MNTPVLEVRELSKRFGGINATDRVDLDVHEGEILAVIGPNGAGKTTLIAQLAGMLAPDSGASASPGATLPVCRRTRGHGSAWRVRFKSPASSMP